MPRIPLAALLACFLPLAARLPAQPDGGATVHVILWFDTEDYLLPASDDAAMRVAELHTARGIRATFKVVGEKARTLERRGRKDVIEALRRHDIGFHSNYHSVHPTPAEYLAVRGFSDGVAEFVRREGPRAAEVRRIFEVPVLSCYGQPGSSWGPQTLAGLAAIGCAPGGVPCYVDSGSHVGRGELAGRPFWYCGALTAYDMDPNETRFDLHAEGALEKGIERFRVIHERLRREGGGLVSIYYHPCEWVHRELWDGVKFRRGSNPPREEWKAPGQLPKETTEAAFARFEKYVDFQRALPGVKFVTASDLPALYPDRLRAEGLDREALGRVARGVGEMAAGKGLTFLRDSSGSSGRILSAADQLAALSAALAIAIEKGSLPDRIDVPSCLGPEEGPPATEVEELPWPAFRDALLDAHDEIARRRQVPSCVFAGTKRIAPADFLAAVASVVVHAAGPRYGNPPFPVSVRIPSGTRLAAETHIAEDTPGLFGGWVIHVEGFRAPRILEVARLQAWTIKPAR